MIKKLEVRELFISRNKFNTGDYLKTFEIGLTQVLRLIINNERFVSDKFPTINNPDRIEILDLKNNNIKILGPKFLSSYTRLIEINLGENAIETLDEDTFGGIHQDNLLISLKNNKLTNEVLKEAKLLHSNQSIMIDLSFNRITEFSQDLFGNIDSNIKINLMANPIQCQCAHVSWIYHNSTDRIKLQHQFSHVLCSDHDNINLFHLDYESLNCPKISEF